MTQTQPSQHSHAEPGDESQTPFTQRVQRTSMKLGIYRRPQIDEETDVYERLGLYDFDADEWVEPSEGSLVSRASDNPSPEELKVRFDLDPDARRTVVATPEAMDAAGHPVEIRDPNMTIEEGHAERAERGGPLPTQTEQQAQRDAGVRVFPDDHDLSEEDREFYEENGDTVITESEWEFSFADEFDFDFTPTPDTDA